MKGEAEKLLKEMVEKLNAAAVGGPLASWFSKWNEKAIALLAKKGAKS